MASAIDITFPGNIPQVLSVAALRDLPSPFLLDNQVYLLADYGLYFYDSSSMATDNGTTVIKPDDITPIQAGRWLLSGSAFFPSLPDLAGASGAGLVGFKQTGALAVMTTLLLKVRQYIGLKDDGAVGSGAVNDYTAVNNALTDYAGGEIFVPRGSFRVDTPLSPGAGTLLRGTGLTSEIKRVSGDAHIFDVAATGVGFDSLKLVGVSSGTDSLTNSGVRANTAIGTIVRNSDLSGMAGSAILSTGGSSFGRFSGNYVHGLTGTNLTTSDVMLYSGTSDNLVDYNRLEGGRLCGVYMQITSVRNKVVGNRITNQTGYGIIDYETTPRATHSLILGNTVRNITGSEFNPGTGNKSFGSGIYTADTGGQIIAFNDVSGCNQQTEVETLAPAGIAQNASNAPVSASVIGNMSRQNFWYGYMMSVVTRPILWLGNIAHQNTKDQFYAKNADHPVLVGNISRSTTATGEAAPTERLFAINSAEPGFHRGAIVVGNRGQGGTLHALDIVKTRFSTVVANNISDMASTTAYAGWFDGCEGNTVSGNVFDGGDATSAGAVAVRIRNCGYSTFTGNMIVPSTAATVAVLFDTANVNVFWDKSNIIFGKPEPMNFIDNQSTGCLVEQFGSAPPTLLTHQVGDTVINRAPAVGQPIGWKCTVAGIPGTWVAMANL